MTSIKFLFAFFITLNTIVVQAATNKTSSILSQKIAENEVVELYVILKNNHKINLPNTKQRLNRLNSVISQLKSNEQKSRSELEKVVKSYSNDYQFFWINNSLRIKMKSKDAIEFIKNPAVIKAYHNSGEKLNLNKISNLNKSATSLEWGLEKIMVPQVWELGYKGQGVVIAGQDTGFQWDHPALKAKYRGWDGQNVDHNYNWHDSIHSPNIACVDDSNQPAPCDDNRHGTHTMGTMVGDDGDGNQIGVAPDAKWIGCRNMNQGDGTPASYTECFQFFIEPTDLNGENPDLSKVPHIINNSWGCPVSEGCTQPNVLKEVVDNTVAAGILVVAAAGNSGSGCNTVNDPIAIYENALTVGSTNRNDSISSFSSRGSVSLDGSNRIKPDISAPGSTVRSSVPDGGYASFSGTSMASPHVAGVAALMISANPALAGHPELIKKIILESSDFKSSDQTCGGISGQDRPNNTYGWGRLNALKAVQSSINYMQSSQSALWYDPNQNGHGINVYMLADNRIVVFWYVYDNDGHPLWLLGVGTHDRQTATLDVQSGSGAFFPPDFNSNDVNFINWGQFKLTFSDCNNGVFSWIPIEGNGYTAGQMNVTRINNTLGLSCTIGTINKQGIIQNPSIVDNFPMDASHSALWYDPEQSGHGINVYMLEDNRIIVFWYVFDNTGKPIWLIAVGEHDDTKAILNTQISSGALFPPNFDSNDVDFQDWGTVELEFSGCNNGIFKWMPLANENGFTAGEMPVVRLNNTLELECSE